MSKATEVLERIIKGEYNFDSDYTKSSTSESLRIMSVESTKLFDDLTQEERMHFADKSSSSDWPILSIWDTTWMYVPLFKQWYIIQIINTVNSSMNMTYDYRLILWQGADYLLDVDNSRLFKEVRTDEVQSQ